ncbi:hypothetical protein NC653_040180 [Populus alba x Populus x berolinensis]|uniref:Uncharacterized protein n=1 Tax=Populus alba x Populus x berolinensis TaxID=444605 RepID=A0AAD6LD08_9ROSI|nr:hypothetical protein NC653_040180 [Populus alba x Populus x berolinensis]
MPAFQCEFLFFQNARPNSSHAAHYPFKVIISPPIRRFFESQPLLPLINVNLFLDIYSHLYSLQISHFEGRYHLNLQSQRRRIEFWWLIS